MRYNTSRKDKLIKRLRYLWTWELFDSLFFPALLLFMSRTLHKPVGLFSITSVALVTWILWQGAAYWWLKLRALRTNSEIATKYLQGFKTLKTVNWAFIGLLPVSLILRGLRGALFSSGLDFIAGLGLYLLAILEQINYYHYQLMYDTAADWRYLTTHKRLKRSKLYQDLGGGRGG